MTKEAKYELKCRAAIALVFVLTVAFYCAAFLAATD